jgi:adenine-specific DNA-methyltransferase
MAYVKEWAPRSYQPLTLRVPELLPGDGVAVLGDALEMAAQLPACDLAYLDPPYNQHRYTANYHVWETLVAWDAPSHYGVACKRDDLRDPGTRSAFNARREMPAALRAVIDALDARLLVVSCSNEGWVTVDDLREWCAGRGAFAVVGFDSRRYVGAQIGVFNPQGERVGEPTHMRNVEYLVLSGDRSLVERAAGALQSSNAVSIESTSASALPASGA